MPDELSTVSTPDRILGAAFVILTAIATFKLLGPAASLLSLGLFVSYLIWIAGQWRKDAAAVLPLYLVGIAVQCLHFGEEYLTGFQQQFPALLGYQWSGGLFVWFNVAWLAVFALAAVGVRKGISLAWLVVIFYALFGGIANGLGHLALALMQRRYFPGAITAPLCLIVGILLFRSLIRKPPPAPSTREQ